MFDCSFGLNKYFAIIFGRIIKVAKKVPVIEATPERIMAKESASKIPNIATNRTTTCIAHSINHNCRANPEKVFL